jgi:hypothetical protein
MGRMMQDSDRLFQGCCTTGILLGRRYNPDMPPEATLKQKKVAWVLIALQFLFVPLALTVVLLIGPERPSGGDSSQGMLFGTIAFVALLVSVVVALAALRPKGQIGEEPILLAPAEFQTKSLIALAVAELAVLLPWVAANSGSLDKAVFLAFVAGAAAVILLVILPLGLKYWAALIEREGLGS